MHKLLPVLSILIVAQLSCVEDVITDSQVEYIKYSDQEYAELSAVLHLPRNFDSYAQARVDFGTMTKATLGRVLFYDKRLSEDGTVSCGSCHHQDKAFADDVALSKGIYDRDTDRNSLALGVFSSFGDEYGGNGSGGLSSLFWDLRVTDVHSQIAETMANEKEMGMTSAEVLARIRGQRHYEILFEKAFQTTKIDHGMVLSALESFMMGMTAGNSKFDQASNNRDNPPTQKLSEQENRGNDLFDAHCAGCHGRTLGKGSFSVLDQFASNGLDRESNDRGLGGINLLESFDGVFKVPSLRNVALTGPYMHDGRFKSLEEVVEFYSEGIQDNRNLHPLLKDDEGQPKKFNLSEEDKKALISFLNSLTDMSELAHQKFSDPWL